MEVYHHVVAVYFFFQAEDGIRDTSVTGVQTCALPIWSPRGARASARARPSDRPRARSAHPRGGCRARSVEIGRASCRKECRAERRQRHDKEKNQTNQMNTTNRS